MKAKDWKWGFKDVWSCWRCIDLAVQIREILEGAGCLNSMEVCRVLNGFDKEDFEGCYAERGFAFVTRPERCNHKERGCHFWSLTVYNKLRVLENKRLVHSEKTRFWDKRKGQGRRLDLFRFWFIERREYERRILRQKIEGYLQ